MIRLAQNPAKAEKIRRILAFLLKQTKVKQRTSQQPLIIAMVGLVGSGKTSVANALANSVSTNVIASNHIRVEIRKRNQRHNGPKIEYDEAVPWLLEQMISWIIKQGGNVIVDADHVEHHKRLALEQLAAEIGAKVIYIRVHCNPKITIQRLIKYYGKGDLFTSPDIAICEFWRRTGFHYYFEGGRWGQNMLKPDLDFKICATIETTVENEWPHAVNQTAEQINQI